MLLKIVNSTYKVLSCTQLESLSTPFRFEVILAAVNDKLFQNHLKKRCCFMADDHTQWGVITSILSDKDKVKLSIEPLFSLTKLQYKPRVFINKSVPEIIEKILKEHGYDISQLRFELKYKHVKHAMLIQAPDESDYDFLLRILSREGIFIWFCSDAHQEILYFADSNDVFTQAEVHTLQRFFRWF